MFYCSDRLLQLTVSLPQHPQQIHFAQMQFEGLKLSHLQQLLVYSDWELIKEKRNQYGYIQSKMYRFFLSLIVAPCHLLLFLLSYSCSRIQPFSSHCLVKKDQNCPNCLPILFLMSNLTALELGCTPMQIFILIYLKVRQDIPSELLR